MKKEMFFLHESWTRRKNIQVTQQESNLKLPGELSALRHSTNEPQTHCVHIEQPSCVLLG